MSTEKLWFQDTADEGTIIVAANAVRSLLPMAACVEEVRAGFVALERGQADLPLRFGYKLPQEEFSVLASMPAFMTVFETQNADDAAPQKGIPFCASKTITVFPGNSALKKHSHQGTISLFEAMHGTMLAIIDAGEVTAIRTAAASAVATHALCQQSPHILAILGCGAQAVTHIEAMVLVRPSLKTVRVWGRNINKVKKFVDEQQLLHPALTFLASQTVDDAVKDADIICTLTPAREPILCLQLVKPGCHINAVGACTPNMRELGPQLVAQAALYTDRIESCLKEPGEIVDCLKSKLISPEHIRGEIGQVLTGAVAGRTSNTEITIFESLGIAIQDLCSALRIFRGCVDSEQLPKGCVQMKINP